MPYHLEYDSDVKNNLLEKRHVREKLLDRIDILGSADKLLLRMYLLDGYSYKQISAIAGVSESTVCKRFHKITERLLCGNVEVYFGNKNRFKRKEQLMLKDHLFDGLSQRKISQKRNVTRYRVRSVIEKFNLIKSVG